ncbi:MAG: type II toxin-antitoxin system VapC family toxin [Parvularculaceae bacterium]|nr:type II toxin-antitoxin system VapC family toxin [Parvularculaceae bacterium]
MIVIDASLAIEIVLATPDGDVLSGRIIDGAHALAAPEIIELEVLQTLRRLRRMGLIDDATADRALLNVGELAIERFSHLPLRSRIWALRDKLTAYDAAYFALAEILDTPLWTRDGKYSSVPGHSARIEIL